VSDASNANVSASNCDACSGRAAWKNYDKSACNGAGRWPTLRERHKAGGGHAADSQALPLPPAGGCDPWRFR